MKILLLLTHSFPYGAGENFLAAELKYASGFDRMVVCPCSREPESPLTASLPENMECIEPARHKMGKAAYLSLLFRPCIQGEMFRLLRSGRLTRGRVHEMLFFMKNAYEIAGALERGVAAGSGDSVVIYSYWFYDAAAAGALFAARLRRKGVSVRVISRAHGFDIHSERARFGYLPMRMFLFRSLDRVYPCSADGESVLKSGAGKYASKIACSYLGTEGGGEGQHGREPFHIVSCSYLVPVKRVHLIAEALKQADFPVLWTHFGSGPLKEKIRQAASELPANVRAEFKGSCTNREILAYYSGHPVSVFVNVSSSEGIPVSVMEACSFGIPVVATNVGGTHEIVSGGENGFLISPDFTPQELLAALEKIRSMSGEDYDAFCRCSRRIWQENFSAGRNYRKFYGEISI